MIGAGKMRHVLAMIVVLCAIFSGMFIYPADIDAASVHSSEVHFVNLIWGLYYGIGFEPAFIWYRFFGPYPMGFVDVFGMIIHPLIASGILYVSVFKLSKRSSRRMPILLAIGLSFLAIIPRPNLPMKNGWLFPLWVNGAMSEVP